MVQKSAACDACRKRKVKCDRSMPCSHCKRLELSCITSWHGARPRGRMGGRGGNKDSLNVRLARLEDILSAIQQENLPLQSQHNVESSVDISQKTSISCPSTLLHTYVAGPIWSQLSEQIEGLREILTPDSDEDEDSFDALSPLKSDSPASLDVVLGSSPSASIADTVISLHPPQDIREKLFTAYCNNIDGGYKIIHRPTIRLLMATIESVRIETVMDSANHAVVFAVYAAALMSLNEQESIAIVGKEYETALPKYMSATSQCLVRADYINSRHVRCLQAFIIYLTVIRFQEAGPKHWALMALAIQLARGLGLDSAEVTASFPPLERETRLRLWQLLRNLDFRSALDRGMEPVIRPNSYDTPLPSNLNDEDLTEGMASYPAIGSQLTDMSFAFVADEGISMAIKLHFLDRENVTGSADHWKRRLEMVEEFDRSVNEKYLQQQLDIRIPIHWMMAYVAHALSVLCQLLAVRPMTRSRTKQQSPSNMGPSEILARAIQSLRAEGLMYQQRLVQGYGWCCWNQWYVLAVALVEICAAPELSRDVETWSLLQETYERQSKTIADGVNGRLWRPIKKLMKKVEGLRESQMLAFGAPDVGKLSLTTPSLVPPNVQSSLSVDNLMPSGLMDIDQMFSLQSHSSLTDRFDPGDGSLSFWDDFLNDMTGFPMEDDWTMNGTFGYS